MQRRVWGLSAGLSALAMLAITATAAPVGKGKAAPAWSGKTVAGKAISSGQYKGKVVLLNFFNNY